MRLQLHDNPSASEKKAPVRSPRKRQVRQQESAPPDQCGAHQLPGARLGLDQKMCIASNHRWKKQTKYFANMALNLKLIMRDYLPVKHLRTAVETIGFCFPLIWKLLHAV